MDTPITDQTALEKKRTALRSKQRGLYKKLCKLGRLASEAEPDELKAIELQLKIVTKQEQMVRDELKMIGPAPIFLNVQDRLLGIALGTVPATTDQALKAIAILMNKEGTEQTDEEPVDWEKVSNDG